LAPDNRQSRCLSASDDSSFVSGIELFVDGGMATKWVEQLVKAAVHISNNSQTKTSPPIYRRNLALRYLSVKEILQRLISTTKILGQVNRLFSWFPSTVILGKSRP